MKKSTALFTFAIALLLSGCGNSMGNVAPSSTTSSPRTRAAVSYRYEAPTPSKELKFQQTMIAVAKSTKQNPNYRKLSLNSPEEKMWFKNLMYHLWDRQITRAQFVSEGVARYPHHIYEFTYVANAFQNY